MKDRTLFGRIVGALQPQPRRSPSLEADFSPHLSDHLTGSRTRFEAECRRRTQNAYLGNGLSICRVLGSFTLFADTSDTVIVPHLLLDGFWEAWVTLAVARALRPGWSCVDVGANHGYYSLLCAAGAGREATLLACEPNPRLATLLEMTLNTNGITGARVIRDAIADTDGETLGLTLPEKNTLNARLVPTEYGHPVRTATLDTLCADLPKVDFVKIDAEGAEDRIWRGMSRTLARCPDITVMLEFNASRVADPAGFLNAIRAAGFPLRAIDDDSQIKPVTAEEMLSRRPVVDWILWLTRK